MFAKAWVLPAFAALALLTVPALADPITGILSITGSDTYSNTLETVSFDAGSGEVGGTSSGTLITFTQNNPVTLNDFAFGTGFTPGTEIFSTTEAGLTATFTLETVSSVVGAEGLTVDGVGILSETNYDPTQATFTLTSQNGGQDINDVTFSATTTASPVPEPASIALLGTGLLGFAGLMRRKLRLL